MVNLGLNLLVYLFVFVVVALMFLCLCRFCGNAPDVACNPVRWFSGPPFDCWGCCGPRARSISLENTDKSVKVTDNKRDKTGKKMGEKKGENIPILVIGD